MRILTLLTLFFFGTLALVNAQSTMTVEELKASQDTKKAEIEKLTTDIADLQKKIDEFPGWRTGAFGVIGANLSGFNDWFSRESANSSAGNIGITLNGFANLNREKFFWRNGGNINLAWVKFDDKDVPTDSEDFEQATDVFTLSSLYGYKLSEKFAVSALGEYRTTVLSNFNDPGYLDLGVGATWTPIQDLVVVFHPLNYNFVFAKEDNIFNSSLGCKILADYTRQLPKGISWKSNLSAFYSYENQDLSNWTWVNGIGFNIWKGIGIGAELGIRGNKQEAVNFASKNALATDPPVTFDNVDNDLQSYWLIGLSYAF